MSNTKPVQTGFAELNGTTLYYEVAGASIRSRPWTPAG